MTDLDQLLQESLDAAADRVPLSADAWIRNEELLHAHRSRRTRTAVFLSTAAAAVVVIVVAVMVWVVPGQHGVTPATGDSPTPPPAATGTPTPTPSAAPTTTSPSAPTSGTGSSPVLTGPANEQADDTLRAQLVQAFTAYRDQPDHPKDMATIPPSAVAGITKNSLYYAYAPSTDTYWARANFDATPEAAQGNDFIGFQDGGSMAVFSRTGDGAWTVTYVGPCDLTIPSDVYQLWSLPSHTDDPMCR